jgi:hypothetical protein
MIGIEYSHAVTWGYLINHCPVIGHGCEKAAMHNAGDDAGASEGDEK